MGARTDCVTGDAYPILRAGRPKAYLFLRLAGSGSTTSCAYPFLRRTRFCETASFCCGAQHRTHFCAGSACLNFQERTQICVNRRRIASACRNQATLALAYRKSQYSLSTYTWRCVEIPAVPISAFYLAPAARSQTYTSRASWGNVPISARTSMSFPTRAVGERTHFCVPIAGIGRIHREFAAYQILRGQLGAKSGTGEPKTTDRWLPPWEEPGEWRTHFCGRARCAARQSVANRTQFCGDQSGMRTRFCGATARGTEEDTQQNEAGRPERPIRRKTGEKKPRQ